MKLKTRIIELLAIAILLLPVIGFAQGRIVPPPPPRPEPPIRFDPFSIKSMFVDVDIQQQVANTTIEQVFHNEANRDLEGTYLFPIPENASISKFTMWMNGEEVEGEVVEARKARQIYEDIVRRMRDPGLLEYIGRGLFRARVYPIPAKGDVRIKIVYEEILKFDSGLVEYRHPLKSDANCGRKIEQMSLAVSIESSVAIKSLYSPTHEIDKDIRGGSATCGFELRDAAFDRDFVLYYTVSSEDVGLNLLTHRSGDDDGYFMMLLSPGRLDDPRKIVAKEVVFVLDKSGSMKGEKIKQAKGALAYCVESLNDADRFNIVVFSTNVSSYAAGLVKATQREKRGALEFVEKIEARGGTDINEALMTALDLPKSSRPRMVVFLTDGLPTVGETDAQRILSNLKERDDTIRIFPFGVGYDVNTMLLDQVSFDHRGTVDYVKPEEDIEVKVSRFYDKVSNPVLADIAIEVPGIDLGDVYPKQIPDLFDGTQLVVLGRYEGHGSKSITLTGHVGDKSKRLVFEGTFDSRQTDHAFIPRIWANRKIAYLLSEIKIHGADQELVDEVIELSLEHGIITPYTSYLILEEGTSADRARLSRAAPSPGDAASPSVAGREDFDVFATKESKRVVSGAGAVGVSKDLADERDRVVFKQEESEAIRYAGGRRFILRDEEWVDAEYLEDMEVVEVEFLGEEYFEMLRKHPEVKEFFALGEKVTFVFNNRAYRITQ